MTDPNVNGSYTFKDLDDLEGDNVKPNELVAGVAYVVSDGATQKPFVLNSYKVNKGGEDPSIAKDGFIWFNGKSGGEKPVCDYYVQATGTDLAHSHTDSCYTKNCGHHNASCYGVTWSVCENPTTHSHTATESGWSVYGNSELRSVYQPVYDKALSDYLSANGSGWYNENIAGPAAALNAVRNTTFCYTTASEPSCGHTCSELGGSCYRKICVFSEHAHGDSCYNWYGYIDADNSDAPDCDDMVEITWEGADGALKTATAKYGAAPAEPSAYDGITPTKEATAQYTYTFTGWDPSVAKPILDSADLVEGVTYTAQYSTTVNTYTIKWLDEDGTLLEEDVAVEYGADPSYDGETPTKAADAQHTYTFAGWTPEEVAVVGNATYKATFSEKNIFTIVFDANGGVFEANNGANYEDYVVEGEKVAEPAAPVREGYRFAGWYTEAACPDESEFLFSEGMSEAPISAGMSLYAKWVEQVNVSFDMGIGSSVDSQTIDVNGKATKPGDPADLADYTFEGWFADAGLTTEFDFAEPVTKDTTVYAKWLCKYGTIQLAGDVSSEGYSSAESTKVDRGTTVSLTLKAAKGFYIKDGVTVSGVSDAQVSVADDGLSAAVSFTVQPGVNHIVATATAEIPAANIVVHNGTALYNSAMDSATVKKNIFDAIYDANLSEPDLTVNDVKVEAKSSLIWVDVTGGYTGSALSGSEATVRISYAGSDRYAAATSSEVKVSLVDERTPFAVTSKNVVVSYEAVDMADAVKSAIGAIPSEGVIYSVEDGWFDDALTHDALKTAAAADPEGSLTVNVSYSGNSQYADGKIEATVSFKDVYYDVPVSVGTVNDGASSVKAYYGKETSVNVDPIEDYRVSLTAENGTLAKNADGSYVLSDVSGNTKLTVVKTALYSVTYTDGVGGEVFADQTTVVAEGEPTPQFKDESGEALARDDYYVFAGWDADIAETVTGEIIYTATWKLAHDNNGNGIADETETYTVVYYDEDGVTELAKYQDLKWGASTPKPENPVKADYKFGTWVADWTDRVFAPVDTNGSTTIAYKATWIKNSEHAVSFMSEGVQYFYVVVDDGATVSAPANPERDGYRFAGWHSDAECTVPYDFSTAVEGAITLYAKWVEQVTVTFNANEGTAIGSTIIDVNTAAAEPADPARDNYTFNGWYSDEALTQLYDFATLVQADITLHAKWTCNDSVISVTGEATYSVNDAAAVAAGVSTAVTEKSNISVVVTATEGNYITAATMSVNGGEASAISVENGVAIVSFTAGTSQTYEIGVQTAKKADTVVNIKAPATPGANLEIEYFGNEITDADVLKAVFESVTSSGAVVTKDAADLSAVSKDYSIMGATLYSYTISKWSDTLGGWIPNGTSIGGGSLTIFDVADTYKIEVVYNGNYKYNASAKTEIKFDVVDPREQGILVLNQDAIHEITDLSNAVVGEAAIIDALVDTESSIGEEYGDLDVVYVAKYNETTNSYIPVMPGSDGAYALGEFGKYEVRIAMADSDKYLGTDLLGVTGYMTIVDARVATTVALNEAPELVYSENLTEEDVFNAVFSSLTEAEGGAEVAAAYGEDLTIEIPDGIKAGTQTVTVKYAGSNTHAASSASVELVINKGETSVAVDSQVVTYTSEGYNTKGFVSTSPEADHITFAVGLVLGDDASADAGVDVYINIPNLISLDSVPELVRPHLEKALGSLSDGSTMTVSELKSALLALSEGIEAANGVLDGISFIDFSIDTEAIDTLVSILAQIERLEGVGDLTVYVTTDNDGVAIKNAGVYLTGAVTTDSNYNTASGIGYLVITPDATKVELAFNIEDENGFVTYHALRDGFYDLGSHVVQGDLTDEQLAEATAQLANLFVGVDMNGEPVIVDSQDSLALGAYTQIAYIADLGNEMFYAEPIVRAFAVVTDWATLEFVGGESQQFVFTGEPQGMTATAADRAGNPLPSEYISYKYLGVEGDIEVYNSSEAPTHAGAYTVIATYLDPELNHAGIAVGTQLITPAEAFVEVSDLYHTYDGAQVDVASMISSTPADAKVALITAGLDVSGDLSENGLSAVSGVVNVDFPARVDELLKTAIPSAYADGITVDSFVGKLTEVKDQLVEIGISSESVDELIATLQNMPNATTLTFKDQADVNPTAIGAYLVIACTMDPDYQLAADLGVLVIAPEVTKATLQWDYEDANGVFTTTLLQESPELLNATPYDADTNKVDAEVAYLYVGINEEGAYVSTADPSKLDVGAYTQIAFIGEEISASMVVAEPIMRNIIVAPQMVDVDFVDAEGENNERLFTYDGNVKSMVAKAYDSDGAELSAGTMSYLYAGVENDAQGYLGIEAPTEAGSYVVTATYLEYDADDNLKYAGIAKGLMVIAPAKASVDVTSAYRVYDGNAVDVSSLVTASPEDVDTVVITAGLDVSGDFSENGLSAITEKVNVDFPASVDAVLKVIVPEAYNKGITKDTLLTDKLVAIDEQLAAIGIEDESLDQIIAVVESMPNVKTVTFKDQAEANPVNIGSYVVIAAVMDPNYVGAPDLGVLAIGPEVTIADLNWNYNDANGIITTPAMSAGIDFDASAYVAGELDESITSEIEYIIVGVTADGLYLNTVKAENLDNGSYTQLAYIYDEVSASMVKALPIMRTIAVVPQTVDVDFVDAVGENNERLFTYDGTPKAMDVKVTDLAGNVVSGDRLENLTVTYVGFDSELNFYKSTEAPTAVGSYKVYANYLERDAAGNAAYIGGAVGLMVIERADADYALSDVTVAHDGTEKWVKVVNGGGFAYEVSAVIDEGGNVNVIAPEGWNVEARSIENVDELIDALVADVEDMASVAQDEAFKAALDKFAAALRNADIKSIEINGEKPSEVGVYKIHSVAFGSATHKPAYDAATLTITHYEVVDEAVPATCTETGLTAGSHCSVCDEVLVAQETVPALGHAEVVDEAVPATCTETGLTAGSHCDVCGEVILAQEEVPAKGHGETELVRAKEATATEDGYTGDLVCKECGEVVEEGEVVPATGGVPEPEDAYFDIVFVEGEGYNYVVEGVVEGKVKEGDGFRFKIVTHDGYNLVSVFVNGDEVGVGADGYYTVDSISDAVTVKAVVETAEIEAPEVIVKRLWGQTAFGTMTAIASEGFANGSCDTVILATVEGYWDALTASSLAGLRSCPVLLTWPDVLDASAEAEIKRLGAEKVYVIGGPVAISPEVEAQVQALGVTTERLAGENAVGTARAIYEEGMGEWDSTAIIATAGGYWDALSISSYAYAKAAPIFLANEWDSDLDPEEYSTLESGAFNRMVICGGEVVVTSSLDTAFPNMNVNRLGGATAYDTSVLIANWCMKEGMSSSVVGVATGDGYWDALTGSSLCGMKNAPIVLVNDERTQTIDEVIKPIREDLLEVYVFGGPVAVSEVVYEKIVATVKG